ncbi:MAG: acyl-CoA dehydrogenase [Rhodospirillaceae bacterium]|nr:acyl-CoA dehydrogenase [Rhodospirillaceae bacterium]
MPSYTAPVRDLRFVLNELLAITDCTEIPGYGDVSDDLIDAVLDGGAKIAEEIWAPLNQVGDEEGCRFENGVVRTPTGFKEAFDAWNEGGWNAIATSPDWGGQGLPGVVGMAVGEMAMSSNLSLSTYVGLTGGAASVLMAIAPDHLKQLYVPKMMSGEWTGTMNLTEPHCGTDLKLMRTKAVEQDDGTYAITGTKIFITGGDHDMTDNIVHLVLAKVEGEGEGLSAVSLFLVPKVSVNDDGSLGLGNNVVCGSIEHKMGIKGSSTAVLHYEGAIGHRLGPKPEPKVEGEDSKKKKRSSGAGMAGMFQMMNGARIGVAYQGVALSEVAYQNAAEYTRERLAGRSLTGAKYPDKEADPIVVHPDVRRMLLHMRAFNEGARALLMWLTHEATVGRFDGDDERKQQVSDLFNLLTPVVKAHFTDVGFECTNMAMQCFGGHGYVREHGMEQFVRDARISQLYEGANGVQALDLVGRRMGVDNGRPARALFTLISEFIAAQKDDEDMQAYTKPLEAGLNDLMAVAMWLAQNAIQNHEEAGAASVDFLRMMGTVAVGYMWARMARVALDQLAKGGDDEAFYKMKLNTARFYMGRVMPDTASLKARATAGAEVLMMPDDEAF